MAPLPCCMHHTRSLSDPSCLLILQPELCLKSPVGITCVRGCILLLEVYRLDIALRLHAIQMVRCF